MIAHAQRIDTKTFDTVFKTSRVRSNALGLLRYQSEPSMLLPRFACIVSKKVSKSSPLRHKLKRRIYALCRAHASLFPAGTYLFFLKKGCESMTYAELEMHFAELIEKKPSIILI